MEFTDKELNEFAENVSKLEGSKNLVNTNHSRAVLGNIEDKNPYQNTETNILMEPLRAGSGGGIL